VDSLHAYRKQADSQEALHAVASEMLQNTIARLTSRGARAGSNKPDLGQALEWRQLDLDARQATMRDALAEQLRAEPVGRELRDGLYKFMLQGSRSPIAARLDAIPGATSDSAARERVGQPFLRDHAYAGTLQDHHLVGPIHVIACQRWVTEAQALRVLGTPDAIAVPSDFGIYAADHALKIQMVFLANCKDETSMAVAVRWFQEWLGRTGQAARVRQRADARSRILRAIAAV
jgi:hypothetical protein